MEKQIAEAVKLFRKKKDPFIQIFSHYDADGLSSAALLLDALKDYRYSLTIVKQVKEDHIERINNSNADLVIFSDLGSDLFEKINKPVIVLDHHAPSKVNDQSVLVNPCVFDENAQTSGSVITYKFVSSLDNKNDKNIYLALVGAMGDLQDCGIGMNNEILKKAEELDQIVIERDINFFGRTTRPIHKALEYSTDPFIPGITGNESGAVQFLSSIGIKFRNNEGFLTLRDLSEEDKKKLASSIIVERLKYDFVNTESMFSEHYYIKKARMDANEFATILNAFGRLEKYAEGVLFCLFYDVDAENVLTEYRKKIANYIIWLNEHKEKVIKENELAIIDAGENIHENFIGTITTISMNSGIIQKPFIVGIADAEDGLKISGRSSLEKINVQKIFEDVVSKVDGETGGHPEAAGAKIKKDEKDNFIRFIINKIKDKKND